MNKEQRRQQQQRRRRSRDTHDDTASGESTVLEQPEPIIVMGEGAYGCVFRFKSQEDSVIKIEVCNNNGNGNGEQRSTYDNEVKIYSILSHYKRKGLLHAGSDIIKERKVSQIPKYLCESLKETKFYKKNQSIIEKNPPPVDGALTPSLQLQSSPPLFQILFIERVAGQDLSNLFKYSFERRERIPYDLTKSFLFQLFSFFASAEVLCGLVHCDLKPTNLMVHQQFVKRCIVFDFNPPSSPLTALNRNVATTTSPHYYQYINQAPVHAKRKVWMVPIPDGRVIRVLDFGFSKITSSDLLKQQQEQSSAESEMNDTHTDDDHHVPVSSSIHHHHHRRQQQQQPQQRFFDTRFIFDNKTGQHGGYLAFDKNHEGSIHGLTPVYAEPDVLMFQNHPLKEVRTTVFDNRKCDSDIWACGLIALEMLMTGLHNRQGIKSASWPIGGCMNLKEKSIMRQFWFIDPCQRTIGLELFRQILFESLRNYSEFKNSSINRNNNNNNNERIFDLNQPPEKLSEGDKRIKRTLQSILEISISQCLLLRALGHPPLKEYKSQFKNSIFYGPLENLTDYQWDLLECIRIEHLDDTGSMIERVEHLRFYKDIVIPRIYQRVGAHGYRLLRSMLSRTQSERLISPYGKIGGFFNLIDSSFFDDHLVKDEYILTPEEYRNDREILYYSVSDHTSINLLSS